MDDIFALTIACRRHGRGGSRRGRRARARRATFPLRPPRQSSPPATSRSTPTSLPPAGRSAPPCSGCSMRCDRDCPTTAGEFLHLGLTTQDVVDTAIDASRLAKPSHHFGDLADDAAAALRGIIERFGHIATQARSFLQPADVTTVGFRTARWLDQLDRARRRLGFGRQAGAARRVDRRSNEHRRRRRRSMWPGDSGSTSGGRGTPTVRRSSASSTLATDLARWADKVGGDIAQLGAARRDHNTRRWIVGGRGQAQPDRCDAGHGRGRGVRRHRHRHHPRQAARARARPRQLARRVVRRTTRVPNGCCGARGDRRRTRLARCRAKSP